MSQRLSLRGPLLLAIAVSLFLVALFYVLPLHAQAIAPAAGPSTADVVVQFGDGLVVTRRITFTGTISGLEALRRTGLALVEKNGGVCRIEENIGAIRRHDGRRDRLRLNRQHVEKCDQKKRHSRGQQQRATQR